MGRKWKLSSILLTVILLVGCTNSNGYIAPSINANLIDMNPQGQKVASNLPFLPDHYIVQYDNESIAAIAAKFAVNTNGLIRLNHLRPPYHLHQGEVINFRAMETQRTDPSKNMVIIPITTIKPIQAYQPVHKTKTKIDPRHEHEHKTPSPHHSKLVSKAKPPLWLWPIKDAKVAHHFSLQHRELDLSVKHSSLIKASRGGTVIFINKNVPKYGNLVIINHHHGYLSAYGHLTKIRVHRNQTVKQGFVIGQFVPGKQYKYFYFETRLHGVAVDPLRLLSETS